jgi:small subunit ribosomal protein S11
MPDENKKTNETESTAKATEVKSNEPEAKEETKQATAITDKQTPSKAEKATKTTKAVKGKKKKKRTIRQISHGRAYIQATYNNTIITLTDLNGNVLAWSSAGQNGFKGPKKATPYAASVIVKDAVEKSQAYGLKNVNVFVKGVGSGRESAIRSLNTYGINVLSIKDITPIPHNGCRQRKPRRV